MWRHDVNTFALAPIINEHLHLLLMFLSSLLYSVHMNTIFKLWDIRDSQSRWSWCDSVYDPGRDPRDWIVPSESWERWIVDRLWIVWEAPPEVLRLTIRDPWFWKLDPLSFLWYLLRKSCFNKWFWELKTSWQGIKVSKKGDYMTRRKNWLNPRF